MITIIAGSRTYTDYEGLLTAIRCCPWEPTTVFSGNARGVDRLGEKWAWNNEISLKIFVADWDRYGKPAGIIRNVAMAAEAEALIAIWDGTSKGTGHMIDIATERKLKVFIWRTP